MSKFYIDDLEKIMNGKVIKLNFAFSNSSKEINLLKLQAEIEYLRNLRNDIINQFKNDVQGAFNKLNISKLQIAKDINFNSKKLFFGRSFDFTILSLAGETRILMSDNGIENIFFKTKELENTIKLINPYIKGIINVNTKTNIFNNYFYDGLSLFNDYKEKVLHFNGNGIFLPYDNYSNLSRDELRNLLDYYYEYYDKILSNIYIPDDSILNVFRTNYNKQKVLEIYRQVQK